jgi:predicted DNA-binding protein
MTKDRVINVHLTEDQFQKLRLISFYAAKPVAQIIREAIDKLPKEGIKHE